MLLRNRYRFHGQSSLQRTQKFGGFWFVGNSEAASGLVRRYLDRTPSKLFVEGYMGHDSKKHFAKASASHLDVAGAEMNALVRAGKATREDFADICDRLKVNIVKQGALEGVLDVVPVNIDPPLPTLDQADLRDVAHEFEQWRKGMVVVQ
jgi:hypothetical protein